MANTVMFITFNLAPGASVLDFKRAARKLHSEFVRQHKGFISWQQLAEGDTWADVLTWASMDDAVRAGEASCSSAASAEYFAFIDMPSCRTNLFTAQDTFSGGAL